MNVAVELDVAIDAVLVGHVGEVLADVGAVGDAFFAGPRLVGKRQREDAAVGAHAGVAEQIPGAADPRTPFQDGVGQLRVAFDDPVGRAQSGDAGADDDDVDTAGVWSHAHREPRLKSWISDQGSQDIQPAPPDRRD